MTKRKDKKRREATTLWSALPVDCTVWASFYTAAIFQLSLILLLNIYFCFWFSEQLDWTQVHSLTHIHSQKNWGERAIIFKPFMDHRTPRKLAKGWWTPGGLGLSVWLMFCGWRRTNGFSIFVADHKAAFSSLSHSRLLQLAASHPTVKKSELMGKLSHVFMGVGFFAYALFKHKLLEPSL